MPAAAYSLAAIPEPFQILGLRLKPFCLGHYFLMARFNVAFVSDETVEATIDDLVLGVLICSMTYEQFVSFLESDNFQGEVTEWGRKTGVDFDLAAKVGLFNEYMARAFKQPMVIFEGQPSESGAHWSQVIKVSLLSMGYSHSEAMNLPLSQAFNDFYRQAENNGLVTIAPPGVEEELRRQDENQEAAWVK